MKIYGRSQFILGVLWAGLLMAHLSRGGETSVFWLLICGMNTCSCLYRAFSQKQQEATKEYEAASRRLFGRWRILVESFGAIVILLAMLSTLWFPNQAGIAIILMICGFVYTLFVGEHIRKHTNTK
ncbi:MAG: hypothetical protein IJ396_00415 [Oscillibacter sp.]|nr:hypothetical protein [Oscillibacter sp.]